MASAVPQPPADSYGGIPQTGKRAKGRKAADPVNTSKAIEDTIAQLERSRQGDKEQELEIEREVKRATRDLTKDITKIQDPLARIDAVTKKYSELYANMRRTEREHIASKKRADQLQKEKDASRSELSKTSTVKEKLEKLCRELQKDNKKLKEDNKRIYDTETRMREDLHMRLESMVEDVQEVIDQKEHPDRIPANMEQDELFRHKFKSFIEQYELRELQFHSVLRTKQLELDYQTARFEQQRRAQEQEASKAKGLASQVSTFSQTETELRSQLNIYVEKFKQVEDTLNNSNDLFLTFRREMEEMSKKTKRLEKENQNLTRKHDATNHNILQMAEERTKTAKEMEMLRKKNENLEKLCRGMQAQGRGGAVPQPARIDYQQAGQTNVDAAGVHDLREDDLDGTESEYEYDDEGSEEYDDDDADELHGQQQAAAGASADRLPVYGPPPPPPPSSDLASGKVNGQPTVQRQQVNGVGGSY